MSDERARKRAVDELYRSRGSVTVGLDALPHLVLDSMRETTRGYRTLHAQEQRYLQIAVRCFERGFVLWHQLLTIFHDCLTGEHTFLGSDTTPDLRIASWHVRLRLAAVAVSTLKITLDATQAGYYSPVLQLCRNLLEGWKALAYLHANPEAAREWVSFDGIEVPEKVDRKTINIYLKDSPSHAALYLLVLEHIDVAHGHVHPSGETLAQTVTGVDGVNQLGANIEPFQCIKCIDVATFAGLILLQELVHQNDLALAHYQESVTALSTARDAWIEDRDFPPKEFYGRDLMLGMS